MKQQPMAPDAMGVRVLDSCPIHLAEGDILIAYEIGIRSMERPEEYTPVIIPGYCIPDGVNYDDVLLIRFEKRACRTCGCTDDRACVPACEWVELDLCSRCQRRSEVGFMSWRWEELREWWRSIWFRRRDYMVSRQWKQYQDSERVGKRQ